MKKVFLVIAIIVSVSAAVNAQSKKIRFSIGVEPALPIGDFNDIGYNFGIGGSLQGEYKVASDLGLTLNAGYMNYSYKGGGSLGLVPVLAGFKYYFSPKVYGHGQLGVAVGTQSGASSFFAYSPGVGFILSKNFDVLIKYVGYAESGITLSSIGARLAYNF